MVLQTRLSPPDWTDDPGGGLDGARCRVFIISRDPDGIVRNDAWFQEAEEALPVCNGDYIGTPCPMRRDCLLQSLMNNDQSGVWGGMTTNQRRWIRRNVSRDLWRDDKHLREVVPTAEYFEDLGDEDPDWEEERDRTEGSDA